ncbi:hypothetical protein EVAR_9025_1 [Eumeta japonica]|uniref:Uncharacterized protein n=1 Tax=Eumeta variegata TaxID=151549 RepID=A0A4C1TVV9_EUMVA|nr:hypothetical protein EVAR_9025_1 [Eumeta japonica]
MRFYYNRRDYKYPELGERALPAGYIQRDLTRIAADRILKTETCAREWRRDPPANGSRGATERYEAVRPRPVSFIYMLMPTRQPIRPAFHFTLYRNL